MIATKNLLILLTSLAALGAASATSVSAQWHEHESPTGVAQHGHHDGDAPKTQHHGDWSPAWNPDDDENTKKPSETNVNYRSNHEESHHDLHWHQTRGEDGLAELRRLTGHKWSSTTKAKHPRDNDHGHEEYEGRFGGATHTAEDDSPEPMDAHVEEYHQDGKFHHARGATLGFYECANHNWVAPCKYTLVEDGKCYNRLYGRGGSMGPDKGLKCTIYERPNCNDKGWNTCGPFVWPGMADYGKSHLLILNGMNDDGPISIRCKYVTD